MIKKIFFTVLLIPHLSWAGPFSSLNSLIKKHENKKTEVSVAVYSLDENKEVYSYKGDRALNPASNVKVLTAAVVLDKLGPTYRYPTEIYAGASPNSKGEIPSLSVVGYGDPSLVIERLWRIAKDLSLQGIKTIKGDLIIDQSYFETSFLHEGFGNEGRAYAAPVSAIALNFNSFSTLVSSQSGKLHCQVDPPVDYFLIKECKTTGKGLSVKRDLDSGKEKVFVRGSYSSSKAKTIYRSVSNPSLYFASALKYLLQQNGIKHQGRIIEGNAVKGHLLLKDMSKPLSEIVADLNKYSNNFVAEMLVKTLGARFVSQPGTTEKGVTVLKDYLSFLGAPESSYELENASGLSRKNKLSSSLLTRILAQAYQDPRIAPEYFASLAIAGTDGTVRRRLKSLSLKEKLRVKTGTLNNVSSLSGLIRSKSGKSFVFSVILEGGNVFGAGAYQLQEKIALHLSRI